MEKVTETLKQAEVLNHDLAFCVKRFVTWFCWLWQANNAARYEARIRHHQKKLEEAKLFADFYRDWADELRNKFNT